MHNKNYPYTVVYHNEIINNLNYPNTQSNVMLNGYHPVLVT